MSALAVGGRRYAAGLYWLGRGGPRATARTARRLGRPWYVHHGERTGFAAGDAAAGPEGAVPSRPGPENPGPAGPGPVGPGPAGLGPEGLPALALALLGHVGSGFWMALVEEDRPEGGGGGRCALVKARDGAVLADGDEVFEDRAAALAAFERARGLGWELYATPGVLEAEASGGVAPLDPAALDAAAAKAGPGIALARAAPARPPAGRLAGAAAGLALLALLAASWMERDLLLSWFAPPEPAPVPAALLPEPRFKVAVDGAALISACRRALIVRAPFLPAWRVEGMSCTARFADAELTALRPELAGRPVLLVRWRLAPGHAEAMQRRLAEAHLGRWHAASVADGRAWAAMPLEPVLRAAGGAAPSFLDLRKAVDRAFGGGEARIGYARGADGAWAVRIDAPGPLPRLARLVGGIDGFEISALSRGAEGGWRLEGRPAAPETLSASQLGALGLDAGALRAAGANTDSDDGEEVRDGTQAHDGT